MTDPTFFAAQTRLTIHEAADLVGARLPAGADHQRRISGIAPLETAGPDAVTFFDNVRYLGALAKTRAGACLCEERRSALVPAGTVVLATGQPRRAFALLAARLYPGAIRPAPITGAAGISASAHIDPAARLELGVTVELGAVVGPGVEIGRDSLIGPGVVIGPGVRLGRGTVVGAQSTVTNALIGNRVVIHPGVRIGQDGFGFVPGAEGHTKLAQIGRVIIQDDVEIGANTTIDRGSNRDTIVGEGTKIDNQVQIAHNVVIGRNCLIAGQVAISGSVTVGDFVLFGGRVGVRDNVKIGNRAQIAAVAAVASDIPDGEKWCGIPARPMAVWLREFKALQRAGRAGNPEQRGGSEGFASG